MSNFKIKSLITTLILGSSSVALADTTFSFNGSAHASWGTPVASIATVRDHRTTTSYEPRHGRMRGTWISLAEPMTGNANLRLQTQAQLNQIRIQSASGSSFISTVTVRFADGTRQQLTFNRWLDSRNPMLQFNLERMDRVDRIMIHGAPAWGRHGSYQVFGYGTLRAERPVPPVYQPPVYQPPVYQPPVYQPSMVTLAAGLNFFGTTGFKFVSVGAAKGRFSTIRIQGLTGQTPIKRLVVHFTNGYGQTLNAIDRNLLAGQSLDIPLDAAGASSIADIVVYTHYTGESVQTVTGEISVAAF